MLQDPPDRRGADPVAEFEQLADNPGAIPTPSRDFSRSERLLVRVPAYGPGEGAPVVTDDEGRAAWLGLRTPAGGSMIFAGTDFVSDLVRYR